MREDAGGRGESALAWLLDKTVFEADGGGWGSDRLVFWDFSFLDLPPV